MLTPPPPLVPPLSSVSAPSLGVAIEYKPPAWATPLGMPLPPPPPPLPGMGAAMNKLTNLVDRV